MMISTNSKKIWKAIIVIALEFGLISIDPGLFLFINLIGVFIWLIAKALQWTEKGTRYAWKHKGHVGHAAKVTAKTVGNTAMMPAESIVATTENYEYEAIDEVLWEIKQLQSILDQIHSAIQWLENKEANPRKLYDLKRRLQAHRLLIEKIRSLTRNNKDGTGLFSQGFSAIGHSKKMSQCLERLEQESLHIQDTENFLKALMSETQHS